MEGFDSTKGGFNGTILPKGSGGGGEGTDNYNDLSNKPKINSVTLSGNKTASDLGLASAEDLEGKIDTPELAGTEGQVLTLDENGNPVWEDQQGGGGEINVIDNLNSDSATDALSAKQGKALKGLVDGKVDKVTGKGLSTNDYTTEDKGKVATALQPSALTPYRTELNQDTIDNAIKGRLDTIEGKESGWDGKQDAISDLADIRQGANDGTEALSKTLNPVDKTSGMTHAVGKDEDGKLWTIPGATSFEDLGYSQFSATETYAVGNVVIYNGKLYEFTASHPAGAWTGTDAKETSVAESIAEGRHPYILNPVIYGPERNIVPMCKGEFSGTEVSNDRIYANGEMQDNPYIITKIIATVYNSASDGSKPIQFYLFDYETMTCGANPIFTAYPKSDAEYRWPVHIECPAHTGLAVRMANTVAHPVFIYEGSHNTSFEHAWTSAAGGAITIITRDTASDVICTDLRYVIKDAVDTSAEGQAYQNSGKTKYFEELGCDRLFSQFPATSDGTTTGLDRYYSPMKSLRRDTVIRRVLIKACSNISVTFYRVDAEKELDLNTPLFTLTLVPGVHMYKVNAKVMAGDGIAWKNTINVENVRKTGVVFDTSTGSSSTEPSNFGYYVYTDAGVYSSFNRGEFAIKFYSEVSADFVLPRTVGDYAFNIHVQKTAAEDHRYDFCSRTQLKPCITETDKTLGSYITLPKGYADRLKVYHFATADDVMFRTICAFSSSSSTPSGKMYIGTDSEYNANETSSTLAYVDMTNLKLGLAGSGTGESLPSSWTEKTFTEADFGYNNTTWAKSNQWEVTVGKRDRVPFIRVVNVKTGKKVELSMTTTTNHNGGTMTEYPVICADDSSNIYIYGLTIDYPKDVDVLVMGDSITQGYLVDFDHQWTMKLRKWFAERRVRCVIGARTGGTINSLWELLRYYGDIMRPKFLMLTIGTNDCGTWSARTVQMYEQYVWLIKEWCENRGCKLILNKIFRNANDENTIAAAGSGTVGHYVRKFNDCIYVNADNYWSCDFESLTSVGYDKAAAYNSSMFNSDGTHLSNAGSQAVFDYICNTVGDKIVNAVGENTDFGSGIPEGAITETTSLASGAYWRTRFLKGIQASEEAGTLATSATTTHYYGNVHQIVKVPYTIKKLTFWAKAAGTAKFGVANLTAGSIASTHEFVCVEGSNTVECDISCPANSVLCFFLAKAGEYPDYVGSHYKFDSVYSKGYVMANPSGSNAVVMSGYNMAFAMDYEIEETGYGTVAGFGAEALTALNTVGDMQSLDAEFTHRDIVRAVNELLTRVKVLEEQ